MRGKRARILRKLAYFIVSYDPKQDYKAIYKKLKRNWKNHDWSVPPVGEAIVAKMPTGLDVSPEALTADYRRANSHARAIPDNPRERENRERENKEQKEMIDRALKNTKTPSREECLDRLGITTYWPYE